MMDARITEIVEQLNEAADVWELLRHTPEWDEAATEQADPSGSMDVVVLRDGTHITWRVPQATRTTDGPGQWVVAGTVDRD